MLQTCFICMLHLKAKDNTRSKWPFSPHDAEGRGLMNHTNGENGAHFLDNLSSKAFMVLDLIVHTKSDGSSCVMNDKRELEREPRLLSLLCTPGQSLCKMGGLSFSELPKLSEAALLYSSLRKRVSFEAYGPFGNKMLKVLQE